MKKKIILATLFFIVFTSCIKLEKKMSRFEKYILEFQDGQAYINGLNNER